jgi:hypothetical protein
MNVYIYRASLICDKCFKPDGWAQITEPNEHSDSEQYPAGPYPGGGGESDTPQYCTWCNVFLENPLTTDGEDYVRDAIFEDRFHGTNAVVNEWAAFYDYVAI